MTDPAPRPLSDYDLRNRVFRSLEIPVLSRVSEVFWLSTDIFSESERDGTLSFLLSYFPTNRPEEPSLFPEPFR